MNTSNQEIKKEAFTLREIDVLGMIAEGHTNQEISQKLHISTETVKWYAKQIYPKLGVSNRTQAALKADEIGLLEIGKASAHKRDRAHRSGNLPVAVTSYIGRKDDIAEIKELICKNRLVTLSGSGGIGKTRLALQAANELQDTFRDGVWLVELAHVVDPEHVVDAIAKVLAVSGRMDVPLETTVKNYLSSKNLLLLIDNFEHLLSAAPLIGDLLAEAPDVSVLATSRERLHINGEIEYPLAPLGLPDMQQTVLNDQLHEYEAVVLFVERAQSARPGFEIHDDQLAGVVRICQLLDGLPLAIELAAPLVKVSSPNMIAGQLENSLDALPDGPRDMPARQRTLRATVDWSYSLLAEDEKNLLTRIAVFNGGATFEAIESICGFGISGNILNIVSSLVNSNLLTPIEGPDGEMYFTMLETTKAINKEILVAAGDEEELNRRHAEYYADLAERAMREYSTKKHTYWFTRIQFEQDNLRSAFEWSIHHKANQISMRLVHGLKNYWRNYGFQKESLRWAESALGRSEAPASSLQAKTLLAAGDHCFDLAQAEKGREYLNKALALFRELGDQKHMAWCMVILGWAAENLQEGVETVKQSLEIFRSLDDLEGMTYAYNLLGELARMQEEHDAAEHYYKQCLELAQETGDYSREGTVYANLGMLAYQRKDFVQAESLTKRGLKIFLETKAYFGISYDIGGLAGAALGMGKYERAARLLGASQAGLESYETHYQHSDHFVIEKILDEMQGSDG